MTFCGKGEGKIRMCIYTRVVPEIPVSILVFSNYLLQKISCTIICSKQMLKFLYNIKNKYLINKLNIDLKS